MEIRVKTWKSFNEKVFYDILVCISGTTIRDSFSKEEVDAVATEFFNNTALDVQYTCEVVPKLIELGVIDEGMIRDYLKEKDE